MADFLYFYPQDTPYPTDGECVNCSHRPAEKLIWLYEWGYWACEKCAEEADLIAKAERTCPVLYQQVLNATSVREVQKLFREHVCSSACRGMERAA